MILEKDMQIRTDQYDGPLGLLLLLIQKQEMDIRNLNMTLITQQYLDYLNQMAQLNFDLAGDFLFMAATLLYLKSEHCLEERENLITLLDSEENALGIHSKADLVRRLEELQKFQQLGQKLWAMPKLGYENFVRPRVDKKELANSLLAPMELGSLVNAMVDFISKNKRKYSVIKRDRLSIKEKLIELKSLLKQGESTNFFDLIHLKDVGEGLMIQNKIITFISLLELARLKKIEVFQNETLSNIHVQVVSSLDDFDVDLADGFESEAEKAEGAGPKMEPAMAVGETAAPSNLMEDSKMILQ